MLILLRTQVCTADDIKNGVYQSIFLGYDKDTCALANAMSKDPMASTMVQNVVCCTADGCNAPPPATPPPVVTNFVVRLSLSLPLTLDQFHATVQLRFREQMAVAAGLAKTDAGRVNLTITKAAGARRLLASGLVVNVSICMDSAAAAQTASTGLTLTAINKALTDGDLPQVRTGRGRGGEG
jgi:hypothetical protein